MAMSETQLLGVIAAGVGVIALAMVVIAIVSFASLRRVRVLQERASEFFDVWQPFAAEARVAVRDFSQQSGELLSRLNSLTALLQEQAEQADSLVKELTSSAHRNVSEIDAAVKGIVDRINGLLEALDRAVRVPATKIRALGAGLGAAFRELSRSRTTSPDRISTDEEMFI